MMAQMSYNVQNNVTGVCILTDAGVPVEYNTELEAQTAAIYYTQVTGQQHIVVGPHPKPRPSA